MVKTFNFRDLDENEGYYNGGWVKKVIGLDKTKQNGYSLLGDFVDKEGNFIYSDGLYLMCDIQGSRNHQQRNYYLYSVVDNEPKLLHEELKGGKDWAIRFWDVIEQNLLSDDDKKKQKIEMIKKTMKDYNISMEDLK
mgnify:CR=1 FL=1